jgi:Probable cobalt transporter subunit (CbtA)
LTAAIVYGLALGGIFAIAFAVAYGRVGRASPRTTAHVLAAGALTVVYLVPFLKYPASPPGTTDPSTVGRRTALYLAMIAISVLAATAAARLRPLLARRVDGQSAWLLAGLAFVAIVTVAALSLPGIHEIPHDFPATTLWRFREASVGMQAVLWSTIGVVFGFAAARVMADLPIVPRLRWRRRVAAPDL